MCRGTVRSVLGLVAPVLAFSVLAGDQRAYSQQQPPAPQATQQFGDVRFRLPPGWVITQRYNQGVAEVLVLGLSSGERVGITIAHASRPVLIVSLKAAFEAAITGMNAGKPPEIESLRGGHVLRAAIRLKLPDGSSTPSIVVGIAPWDRLELILLAAPHQQTINTYLPVFSKFWRSLDYPPYRNSEALVGFTMPHATPGPLEGLYGDYLFMRSGHVIVNPDAASLVMGPDTFTNWEAMASANWDPTDNHTRQIDLGVYEVIGAKLRISYHSILAYLDERVLVCKQIGSDDCGKEKVVEGTFHTSPNRIQIGQTMIEKQEDQTGKTLSGKFATFAARDKASFTSDGKFTMHEIGTVYAVPLSSGTLTPISGDTTNGQGAYEISRYTMILRFTDGHVETRRFEDLGTNPESGRTFRLGGRTYNERWAK